jgi:uncharacterized protein YndB with AHSA1/START domain
MSVAPILRSVVVTVEPGRAFELFTRRIQDWWPRDKTIGRAPAVAVVIEPQPEGRWFERDAQGHETQWGKVLAWEPPQRLLLAWQVGADWAYHAELITEVELTFKAQAAGGTLVTLEHRYLERLGAAAARHREMLDGGWPSLLGEFQKLAEGNTTSGATDHV